MLYYLCFSLKFIFVHDYFLAVNRDYCLNGAVSYAKKFAKIDSMSALEKFLELEVREDRLRLMS